ATAGLERVSCDRLSTLVFCNPWEDTGIDIETTADSNLVGRSMMYFAPNFDGSPARGPVTNGRSHGSHFRWSEPNQLYTMSDPIADDVGVCDIDYLQPYFALTGEDASSEGAPDYLEVRDRCLLARTQVEQVCYEDNTIGVRPAHGPTVLSAINIAFDIYNEPMDRVISATSEIVANASNDSLDLSLSNFFEPDAVVSMPDERMIDVNTDDTSTPLNKIRDTGADGVIDQTDYLTFMDGQRNVNSVTGLLQPEVDPAFEDIDPDVPEQEVSNRTDTNSINSLEYGTTPAPMTRILQNRLKDWGVHDCHRATETFENVYSGILAQAVADSEASGTPVDLAAVDQAARNAVPNSCAIDFVGDQNLNPFDFTFGSPDFVAAVSEYGGFTKQIQDYYDIPGSPIFPIGVERPWYDFYLFERSQMDPATGAIVPGGILGDGASAVFSIADWNDLDYDSSSAGLPVFNAANDSNRLKNSPLDPDLHHEYSSIGIGDETHPMESFHARTGRTSLTAGFDFERRRIKAAFVNCRAVTAEDPNDPEEQIYDAEIVEVLDVFLSRPAEQFCGLDGTPRDVDDDPNTPNQTISNMTCDIQNQVETRLFIETIGRAQQEPLDLFTAQLVR
ncbi:MAG: hypothetical protein AAF317_15545, partial [Pseudomonadota bacterium]